MAADARQLDRLFKVIAARKGADAASSYTAKLFSKGVPACAQKLGEEAVETVIAAIAGDRQGALSESADLLYHWLVLIAALDLDPADVYAELERREGRSGLDEKAARTEN
ncbi:phosphoribosyl-ATP diphosphatase [Parvibaculum sp.]|jgi:phosphoribosyl-ATP pyrophosphohydrolase|uniref:phosphoribosyl-ATP diphosphatase n=1 Tax=Parvibaculum sp. TaxID=2024848 RepID=UPI000C5E6903|nr:phosphoribosyl-ATP diphosphatase [Parvibaculum sp.]MAM95869.1 phosphoribosyl-ATP diphosphatase [Parvibaculum sp.]HCX67185.1 phosphoribosyl-ATP diphosphatase [Rhodobiaceae bacterium]|tara:strand:- start:27506 stop:27835 length:330 start_codon:yes stop_codon:yes gene_type:complete